MRDGWMIDKGDLTEMPNPMDEEIEKEIRRLQILAVPFVDEIMPKIRSLSSQTKGMTPGQYIPLAIGVLVEQIGLSKKEVQ